MEVISQDSAEQNFEYDALSQLRKATGSYGELNYSYDKIGNRKSKTIKGQVQSYDYKTQNHHLTKVTREGSTVPTQLAKYNQAGRLSVLTQNNQVTHYQYNYLALRASKANSTEHVHYHYNLDGLLIAESTAAGQWQKEYIYFGNELVALIDYQSNSQGELYFVHSDYLATPKLITDSQKQVVWQAEYTPFGLGEINQDADGDGQQLVLNIRFPGQYFDKESKLHYNWHRYYDPEIGRYIRSDPIGLDDGPSTYGYAHQNPIINTDPSGEFVPQLFGFFVGAGLEYFSNKCATASDIFLAGALGAVGGGVGAKLGLKYAGRKGLNKQFSHFIPSRYIRKNSSHYKPWLDNRIGRKLIKGQNKWNGNYVHVKRHFKHDPYAWGNAAYPGRTLGQKWSPARGLADRIPKSWRGTGAGIGAGTGAGKLLPKNGECGCGI